MRERPGPRPGLTLGRATVLGALLAVAVATALDGGRARGADAPAGGRPPRGVRFAPPSSDLAIVLSGREAGFVKPCGCSSPQRGGLARRAALLEDVRRAAKRTVALSVGDTLGLGSLPAQAELKAEFFRGALVAMRYDAMLLSPEDLLPLASALTQVYDGPAGTPRPPRNVMLRADGPLAALSRVEPVVRILAGDAEAAGGGHGPSWPVRAVSVVDPTLSGLLVEEAGVAQAVIPPGAAIDAIERGPGVLVVAAHTMREDLAVIATRAAGKADVVIVVDILGEAARRGGEPVRAYGGPLLVTFADRGTEAAVVSLERRAEGVFVGWTAVPLDPVYEDGESAGRASVEALFSVYKRNVADGDLLRAIPVVPDEGPGYVGAAACAACHEAIVTSWQATPHAWALETLRKVGAERDPECVACHVVGWSRDPTRAWQRTASSFRPPRPDDGDAPATATRGPVLHGVQCESCHGPGADHVAAPHDPARIARHPTPGRLFRTPTRATCAACHDPDNSHPFHAPGGHGRYLERVDHRDVAPALRTVLPPGTAPGPR